jgi:hypothetical protein
MYLDRKIQCDSPAMLQPVLARVLVTTHRRQPPKAQVPSTLKWVRRWQPMV